MRPVRRDTKRKSDARLGIVGTGVFLAMATLIVRMGDMQVSSGKVYIKASLSNAYDTFPVPASRGWIYDRYHYALATDKPTFDIVYTKLDTPAQDNAVIAKQLAVPFGMRASEIEREMPTQTWDSNPQVTILANAPPRIVSYVEEHASELPGVSVIAAPLRQYPYGALADHVLGYISSIPASQASTYAALSSPKYPPNALVGQDGIEAQYDQYLQGTPGAMKVEVNAANVPVRDLGLFPAPKPGDNVVLNIDGHLQDVLQQSLQSQIQALQGMGYYWVKTGVAVAMDPNTGAILALGSYPFYDPQWFVGGISSQHYAQFGAAALDSAVGGLYPPGSTEKPLTLMYALNQGVINAHTTVWDPGYLYVGGTRLNEWVPSGFGSVSVPEAIGVSSDVFLYQTGLWLGHYPPSSGGLQQWMTGERVQAFNGLANFAKNFGLTAPTGVDLPGEVTGYFHDNGYLSDLAYMAIGQDQVYTPIGIAQYVSAIANGGKRMKPEVLHEILSPSGKVVKVIKPVVLNHIPVSAQNLALIQDGMAWTTQDRGGILGTAWSTFLGDRYAVSGKTGTAQTGVTSRDVASFMGYAPSSDPKIAVVVIIPGAGEGFQSSGPVARKIIDAYLNQLASGKSIAPTPLAPSGGSA
ncbi:MAG: penicillin-binding transpeptidase domain-containing protein [Firmicutes bacterium]|nr:penicillin-binding transpeptidase domain-containing protein [Bacillota bacterium]